MLQAGLRYPIHTWRIVRGDTVEVISGKCKGQRGVVQNVKRKKNRLLVEGVNLVKKHIRTTKEQKGGIFALEAPVHYSNCMLIDPTDDKPCRVGFKYLEDGKKVRVSKRSGAIIPRPAILTAKKPAEAGPLDTPADIALKVTLEDVQGTESAPSASADPQ